MNSDEHYLSVPEALRRLRATEAVFKTSARPSEIFDDATLPERQASAPLEPWRTRALATIRAWVETSNACALRRDVFVGEVFEVRERVT